MTFTIPETPLADVRAWLEEAPPAAREFFETTGVRQMLLLCFEDSKRLGSEYAGPMGDHFRQLCERNAVVAGAILAWLAMPQAEPPNAGETK